MPWPTWATDLGTTELTACVAIMEARRARVQAGEPGHLYLTTHLPVISLGRRATAAELVGEPRVPVVRVSRGGLATAHGPGQLVLYPVVRLRRGVVEHVCALGTVVADWLRAHGVDARYSREHVGVLAGGKKLAAIGVHVARGVAIHGIAFNLEPAVLPVFAMCVPCGRSDTPPGTARELVPHALPEREVIARDLVDALGRVLGLKDE